MRNPDPRMTLALSLLNASVNRAMRARIPQASPIPPRNARNDVDLLGTLRNAVDAAPAPFTASSAPNTANTVSRAFSGANNAYRPTAASTVNSGKNSHYLAALRHGALELANFIAIANT